MQDATPPITEEPKEKSKKLYQHETLKQIRRGEERAKEPLDRCMKCGGNMVVRYNAENKIFTGCSRFPDCHFTRDGWVIVHQMKIVEEAAPLCPEIRKPSSLSRPTAGDTPGGASSPLQE